MEDSIDMANHSIIRLKDPKSSDSFHASTVNYVNRTISDNNAVINTLITDKVSESEELNIKANRQENEFSFVMDDDLFKEDDDDIVKVRKVDKDYYNINKSTYQFKIKYDSAIGYYSGAPAAEGRQAEPHTHIRKLKGTHELIFSCVSWLAVLLVGAYAR